MRAYTLLRNVRFDRLIIRNQRKLNHKDRMAIYHFSGTVISRSQGRSAVACAAYRSGELLKDEKYDRLHDYTHKQDIAHQEILLPEKAPDWMSSREKLWNAVEAAEKRKDAQLAREFNFALPRELTLEQNIMLAQAFTKAHFVDQGMVADLCVHNHKNPEGELQPHAHVMLTMREVTSDGFGSKVRAWNAKEKLLLWREAWAESVNHHLALNGHDLKVDHRTLKEQGIALEPQYKIGAAVVSSQLARHTDHLRIARENGEKLLSKPEIALEALTRQHSTFTHQDIARFVSRHTVDAEQFQTVFEKVRACEPLVLLGKDEKGRERYTSEDMLLLEARMLKSATHLVEKQNHAVKPEHLLQAKFTRVLTPEQETALEHVTSPGDLKCVLGFAGTGKSYFLGAAKEAWEWEGYQVLGGTLSGIAAENLSGSSGILSRTLASRFYYWDRGEQLLTSKDILVVDEAGMIGSRQMERVLTEAKNQGAKVVLVGDPEQLQAIEAGAAFRALSERVGMVELTEIRRQREAWQQLATQELATGKTEQALSRYRDHHHLHGVETLADAKRILLALWNDARISQSEETQMMLAYTRAEVKELNELARAKRHALGELGVDHFLQTERGERAFAEHDRIYFLKNDRQLGVMNGTLGTLASIQDKQLTVRLDPKERGEGTRTVMVHLDYYNHLEHGYAATIHKMQGGTVDRSYLLPSQYLDRHSTYPALTRHRKSCEIVYDRETFPTELALFQTLSRERAKDVTLDYLGDFAKVREIAFPALQKALQSRARERDFLDRCMAKFERENPEKARAIRERLRPWHEETAIDAQKEFTALERASLEGKPHAREKLTQYAEHIAKQADVMGYLKENNQVLAQKIGSMAKQQELIKTKDFSLGL